jgi:hypothetical protein
MMPDIRTAKTKTRGIFVWLIAHRYANINRPDASAPKMKTGLRPTRSASIAHNGIAISATIFVRIATHSIVVRSIFTVLTAYDSA